ncbi:hypothetical protein OAZ03_03840 [Gammaproteobacteria bacterium]|nr:hypothetical protein [Gammaproteobacteria bacterium]MDA9763059.1 hypothetical protein [Gammaproteobacteria bacterium]MDC3398513.1 hypothetical protein [Gammaproteobacteria bacterium]
MKNTLAMPLMVFGIVGCATPHMPEQLPNSSNNNEPKAGLMYFLSSNYVSGLNRICTYKNGSMIATHTMPGISMCPINKRF